MMQAIFLFNNLIDRLASPFFVFDVDGRQGLPQKKTVFQILFSSKFVGYHRGFFGNKMVLGRCIVQLEIQPEPMG